MARPGRMKEIVKEHAQEGEDAVDVVIRVLNAERSLPAAARTLNISYHNLFLWVKANNIRKLECWIKPD